MIMKRDLIPTSGRLTLKQLNRLPIPKTQTVWKERPLSSEFPAFISSSSSLHNRSNLEVQTAWIPELGEDRVVTIAGTRYYVPTKADLETVSREFPNRNPRRPVWQKIPQLLIRTGRAKPLEDLKQLTAAQLVMMLTAPVVAPQKTHSERLVVTVSDAAKAFRCNRGTISNWARKFPATVASRNSSGRVTGLYAEELVKVGMQTSHRESAMSAMDRLDQVLAERLCTGKTGILPT
jgi:hypothetical protein